MRGKALLAAMVWGCVSGGAQAADEAGAMSPCLETGDVELCIRFTAELDDWRQATAEARDRAECAARFAAAEGKGVFRCAGDAGDSLPDAEATAALGAELAAAITERRGREADDLYRRIVHASAQRGARACTVACNEEGGAPRTAAGGRACATPSRNTESAHAPASHGGPAHLAARRGTEK
jgi:hypothetical protein